MKKTLVFLLMTACIVSLAACGSDSTDQTDAVSEESGTGDAAADAVSARQEDSIKTSDTVFTEATVEDTELYNANGITVTATEFDANASYGPEIGIRVQNESDRTVEISAGDVSVNGYMLDPGLLYIVAMPGQTIEDVLTLYNFVLDSCGIDTVAEVALSIIVTDDETLEEIDVGDRVTLTTSAAEDFTQAVDDSGDVIYDEDGIRVVNQGLQQDDIWDGDLVLYFENNTDRYLAVSGEDVVINGQDEEDTSFWADLKPDTRTVSGMYLLDLDDQDINSIDDVEEISFHLLIVDQDEMEQVDESDTIILNFK